MCSMCCIALFSLLVLVLPYDEGNPALRAHEPVGPDMGDARGVQVVAPGPRHILEESPGALPSRLYVALRRGRKPPALFRAAPLRPLAKVKRRRELDARGANRHALGFREVAREPGFNQQVREALGAALVNVPPGQLKRDVPGVGEDAGRDLPTECSAAVGRGCTVTSS